MVKKAKEESKNETPLPEYATKADLDELKNLITTLASAAEKKNEIKTLDEKIEPEAEKPDAAPISPKYRKLVDEVLGTDFGVNVVYPDSGTGFLFKIIVPMEKSNATQAHKEFYKCDVRTKAIGYQEGIEGVKKFIEKVAKNLKIEIKK